MKSFASDNNSGVHPNIMEAVKKANSGDFISYGDDVYTKKAKEKFQELFGEDIEVAFVLTGTAANVLSLANMLKPFEAVIAAESAHIYEDECGAPERFTGCKIIPIKHNCGKIKTDDIERFLDSIGFEHHSQPKVISITQATELGCVYKKREIEKITDFAHKNGLLVHMDGARIANAAVTLNMDFKEFTKDACVDVLSFGGTKNGLMMGEAVVFFNKELAENIKFLHKQTMQLYSKMRFVSAQFIEYLSNELWKKNAQNANNMAKYLSEKVKNLKNTEILFPVESNELFVKLPKESIEKIQQESFFYIVDKKNSTARWVVSFDTKKEDIENFHSILKKHI